MAGRKGSIQPIDTTPFTGSNKFVFGLDNDEPVATQRNVRYNNSSFVSYWDRNPTTKVIFPVTLLDKVAIGQNSAVATLDIKESIGIELSGTMQTGLVASGRELNQSSPDLNVSIIDMDIIQSLVPGSLVDVVSVDAPALNVSEEPLTVVTTFVASYNTATTSDSSVNDGSISIASGIVQGTNSLFTTELVVDDIIQSADGQTRTVTEIISNTVLRVNTPFSPKIDFLSKLSRTIDPFIIRDEANAIQFIATKEGRFGIGVPAPSFKVDINGAIQTKGQELFTYSTVESATSLPLTSISSPLADTTVKVIIALTAGFEEGDTFDVTGATGFNETNRKMFNLIPNTSFEYISDSVKSSTPVTVGNIVAPTTLLIGTGTTFTADIAAGDSIGADNFNYSVVKSIIDDTNLILDYPFNPPLASGTTIFKLEDFYIMKDHKNNVISAFSGAGELGVGVDKPLGTLEVLGINPLTALFNSLSVRRTDVHLVHAKQTRIVHDVNDEPRWATSAIINEFSPQFVDYTLDNLQTNTRVITIAGLNNLVGIGENFPEANLEVSGGFGNLIRVSRTGNSGAHMAISNVGGAFGLGGIINSSIRVIATSFNAAIGLGLFARTDFSMQVNSLNSSGPAGMGALAELPHELLVAGSAHVRIAEKLMFGFFSGTITSVDITGINTSFLTQLTKGDRIKVISTGGGQIRTVVAIADNTHLTIDFPWDVAFTNSTFNRLPSFVVEDDAKAVKFIINDLGHVGINTLNPIVPFEMKGGVTIDLSGKMQDGLIDDFATVNAFEAIIGTVTVIATLGSLVNGSLVDVTNAGIGSQNNATVSNITTSPDTFEYGVFPLNTTFFATGVSVSIAAGIVQGTSTSFTTELAVKDEVITTTGQIRTVTEIISDTLIRVNAPFNPKLDFDSTLQKVIPHVLIRDVNNNIQFSINHSGHVGIGNALPDPSAALDVETTNKGILFPRLTTAQKLLISSPATGLVVFDTDKKSLAQRSLTEWRTLATNADTDHDVFSELDLGIESGGTVTIQSGRYVLKKAFTTPNKWKTAVGANVTIESFDRNNTVITYTGNGTFLDFTSIASITINNIQFILTDNAANLYIHSGGLIAATNFFANWTGTNVTGKIGDSTNVFAVAIDNSLMSGFLNGITLENVLFSQLSAINWTSKGTGTGAMFTYKGVSQGLALTGPARLEIGPNETLIDAETTIVTGQAVLNIEKWNKVGTGDYFPTVTTKNITAFAQDGFPATSVTNNRDAGFGNGAELTKAIPPFTVGTGDSLVLAGFTGDKIPYNGIRAVKDNNGLEFIFNPPLAFIPNNIGLGTMAYHRTTVTVIAHGYSNGQDVQITGSDNNDGSFVISDVTADTFDILSEFVATGTGIVADGLNQKSPGVTVVNSVGSPNSTVRGGWKVLGKTTGATPMATTATDFTDINFVGNGTLTDIVGSERIRVSDAATGTIEYFGRELDKILRIPLFFNATGNANKSYFLKIFVDKGAGFVEMSDIFPFPLLFGSGVTFVMAEISKEVVANPGWKFKWQIAGQSVGDSQDVTFDNCQMDV